ncbi:DUF4328 domain-containing protein [Kutzneria sp. NPDC052558]|uniref:DUF4328 domain-containing protein n=1 Tax=Kutzneria sp. NPDC052558 TaxID=3364121 RepID=UPI0037CA8717
MEPNHGAPLGAPMSADQRRNHRQWRSVGAISIAASALVGLVALVDVLETIAEARGLSSPAGALAVAYLLALAAAAVVFVVWLWQVRSNAEIAAGPATQRLGRGWAIGAWICPIVNFWFPYQYVVDVWRASAPNREDSGEGLVLGWWLCFFASNVCARIATYGNGIGVVFVAAGLDVVSAVLAVLVIRRVTEWQSVARA